MDAPHLFAALRCVALRIAESVGRPIGSAEWLKELEERSGKTLASGKRGPKPRANRGSPSIGLSN
jgi:hypothetical protein